MKNFPKNYISISQRMRQIISLEAPERGRSSWLEEKTGIPKKTWQSFWGRQDASPSADMIQSISRVFPKYAFWLASGLTDQTYGHTYPMRESSSKCFPEIPQDERKRFEDYFMQCMKLQDKVYGSEPPYEGDEQLKAIDEMKRLLELRHKEIMMFL